MVEPSKQAPTLSRGAPIARPPLGKLFLSQLVLLLLITLTTLGLAADAASSVFLGGVIATGPNALFALSVFRYTGARAASYVTRSFYRGEAIKFLLTAVLFAGVFAWVRPLRVEWLFLAFAVMTVANWLLALRILNYRN